MDCGATCLQMVAHFYGQRYPVETLREIMVTGKQGVSLFNLSEAAEQLGFRTEAVATPWDTLRQDTALPCIAHWQDQHYVVLYHITSRYVYVADPAAGRMRLDRNTFLRRWRNYKDETGVLLLLEPTPSFYKRSSTLTPKQPGSWRFLLSYFRPYQRYLWQLLWSVLAVSIIQWVFPFLAQSLVDEGIQHQNLPFIYLILAAQLVLFVSQTISEVIRSYLLLHLGNRVSLSLLSSFLQKLMLLPHAFFEQKNLGDLLQRIEDNQRIENFLTSQSLHVLFSALTMGVFSLTLIYYNPLIFSVFALPPTSPLLPPCFQGLLVVRIFEFV